MQSVKELGGSKLKELLIVSYDSYFWRTFENFTFLTTPDFTTLKKKTHINEIRKPNNDWIA